MSNVSVGEVKEGIDSKQESAKEYLIETRVITGSKSTTTDDSREKVDEVDEDDEVELRTKASLEAMKRIRQIVQEHDQGRKAELAAFLDLDRMDDVFAELDRRVQKDPSYDPVNLYRRMLNVYEDVEKRRSALFEQLKLVRPNALIGKDQEDYKKAEKLATSIRGVGGPLPSDFEPQREKLVKRLTTLAASKEEKVKIREEVEEAGKKLQGKETEDFKKILEKAGTRSFERMDSFDPFIAAGDPEDIKLLHKQLDAARDRYFQVLDCGGTTTEAEKQLSHFPKCWWPPSLVKEVHAWRAIERRRQDEAIKRMFEEAKHGHKKEEEKEEGDESAVKTIGDAAGLLSTLSGDIVDQKAKFSHLGINADDAEKICDILSKIGMALDSLQAVTEGVDFAQEFGEFKEKSSLDKFEKVSGAIGEFGETLDSALEAAENISEAAKAFVEKFVGPVVIASGVAKFLQGCAQMKKLHGSMKRTGNLINTAEIEMGLGSREDGGALVRSMENSRSNQKVKLAQAAVDTFDATLQVAEGSMDTAGQPVAKYVITAVRNVISLASKVAFAEVNFRKARTAMRTLDNARAGSMVAQIEIFENSSYYAMSYIAYLVENDDPIANSFSRRAVTEADVKNKDYSTSVLAELMQKAAGTFDVDQGSETRTEALKKTVKGGFDAVKEKLTAFQNKYFPKELPGSAGVEYDPKWAHEPGDVGLSEGHWMATRRRAIQLAGLFDNDQKVPEGFLSAAEAFTSLGIGDASQFTAAALQEAAKTAGKESALRNKNALVNALANLEKCAAAIDDYDAFHTPYGEHQKVGPHAGFIKYQTALTQEVNRCVAFLELKSAEDGWLDAPRNFSWKPPTKIILDAPTFLRDWEKAAREAWLSEDPPTGVISALNEVGGAELATRDRENSPPDATRDANKRYFDMLSALVKEIDKAWSGCQHPGLKDYMSAMKLVAATIMRELDKKLYELKSFKVLNTDFSAKAWKETYEDARNRGAADEVNGLAKQLASAFEAWEKASVKIQSAKVADQIDGRTDGLTALKDVNKHAIAVGLKIGSTVMSEHCATLAAIAKNELIELNRKNDAVKFTWQLNQLNDPEGWKQAYLAAVTAGAVVDNKSQNEKIAKALTERSKRVTELISDVTPKERRKIAGELIKATEEASNAIRDLKDDKGHRNNNFQQMAEAAISLLETTAQAGLVANVLSGARGGPFKPVKPKSAADRLNWDGTDGAQNLAIEAGILEKANDEFGNAIGQVYTYNNLFKNQSETRGVIPKELIETKRQLREALERVKKLASKELKSIDNDNYKDYMQEWINLAEKRLKELSEKDGGKAVGEFDPPRFAYTDENWQLAKSMAVGMNILDDVRTNVGKFLKLSNEKFEAYDKLRLQTGGNPETLESARQEAIKNIRLAMSFVSQIRKLNKVKNEKWEKYLDQMVVAIQDRYDQCTRKSSVMVEFDLKLPQDPTLLDWQRAQDAVVDLSLLSSPRYEPFGSVVSESDTKCNLFFEMCTAIGITKAEAEKAKNGALDSLKKLQEGANIELSTVKSDGFKKYMEEWASYARQRSELVEKRFAANFD